MFALHIASLVVGVVAFFGGFMRVRDLTMLQVIHASLCMSLSLSYSGPWG